MTQWLRVILGTQGGSVSVWLVRLTTKLATRVRFPLQAELSTDDSVLGGNLSGYCYQQYQPRLINQGVK